MMNEQIPQNNNVSGVITRIVTVSTILFSALLWMQLLSTSGCGGGPMGDDNSTSTMTDSNNQTTICQVTIVDERELDRLIEEADNGEGGVTSVEVYATDSHGDITINLCTDTRTDDDQVYTSANVNVQAANANTN